MLPTYLIGLREGLEAALIVTILLAYLTKSGRATQLPRVWLGVGAAITLSLGFSALLSFGPASLPEGAEETITGLLSLAAVGLVTWMIFWMAKTGHHMASDLRQQVDDAGPQGWALPLVGFLAVGREGFETALFLWATTGSTGETGFEPILGALLGIATAIALGWLIYRGSIRINLSKFFAWTAGLLIVVAAGVLAYSVHEFQEASVLPGEDDLAFDITGVMPKTSLPAVLLRGTLNIRPAMSVLEVAAWLSYVVVVGLAYWWVVRSNPRRTNSAPPAPPGAVAGSAASDVAPETPPKSHAGATLKTSVHRPRR